MTPLLAKLLNRSVLESQQTFLAIGSNLGDRRAQLQQAQTLIGARIGTVVQASHVYVTQAWGLRAQADFLNQVLEVQTLLSPNEILQQIQQIEQQLGRERRVKWGARVIDIDILFYNHQIVKTENLIIPHPFLHERNFVLVPMAEIAPDFQHPIFQLSIAQLLAASKDELLVKILEE